MFEDLLKFEARVDLPGKKLMQCILLHEDEIARHIQEGTEEAVLNLGPTIKDLAMSACKAKIMKSVEQYFAYGEGGHMIEKLVHESLGKMFKTES